MDIKIVVLQRGWVLVGRFRSISEIEDELTDASVIRFWGTTKGLGQLVDGPTPTTKLDPCGKATFHPMTVVFKLDAKETGWASVLR
jgi:hypothetical protein